MDFRTLFHRSLPVFLGLAALSCGRQNDGSKPRWGIDASNDPRNFGVFDKLSYDELKTIQTSDSGAIPWADTYWPLVRQGVSFRSAEVPAPRSSWDLFPEDAWPEPGLARFLATHVDALDANSSNIHLLSPAEKHDAVFRALRGASVSKRLARREIEALGKIEKRIDAASSLPEKKDLARELESRLSSSAFISQNFPLSRLGWIAWLQNSAIPEYQFGSEGEGSSWSWMGHCHGWSAAAIMEEPPRHSVLAHVGDRKILFTEGDIRGLLTKAWAENAQSGVAHFAGRRCDKNMDSISDPLPADAQGRVYGGEIESSLLPGKQRFHEVEETHRWNDSLKRMQLVHTLSVPERNLRVYYIEPQSNGEIPLLFTSFVKLNQYLSTGTASLGVRAKVDFFGCRDVNPASLHTLLVKYLGQKGSDGRPMRLVMDRTPSGQVWNQPVFKADFSVGDLKNVKDITDRRAPWRASGTTYVAEVRATIYWTTESDWPYPQYASGYDASRVRTTPLQYTLEFDADKTLIGGEWGLLGETQYRGWAPDFLWTYESGTQPADTDSLNYSKIIKPIHDCSLAPETTGEMEVDGNVLHYSECDLRN